VGGALTGQVDGRLLADVELVVSELVTNCIQHAGLDADDVVRVGASVGDSVLRLAVGNRGCAGTIAMAKPDLDRGAGFGLYLVDALAHTWGVSRDADTVVWAEFVGR
jgi:serine/threonine-protein kinase RsbW